MCYSLGTVDFLLMLQDEILPWFEKTKRKKREKKQTKKTNKKKQTKKTEVTTSNSQLKMKS